jgi:predicted RNA-binding Zn ribbon-like protein
MTPPPRPPAPPASQTTEPFAFVGERLWLDFVNSDDTTRGRRRATATDALNTFEGFIGWLSQARLLDDERAVAMARRAQQQPTGASAALHEARRLRNVLRALAERGGASVARAGAGREGDDRALQVAIAEINRVLGRSAGTRRVEPRDDGKFVRNFVTVGDVFAGLLTPVIESAADSLVNGELARVHRCADPRCGRVFYDSSRNGKRRWCDMTTCGNRAKAARHRRKVRAT